MNKYVYIFLSLAILVFMSCKKEEMPIDPHIVTAKIKITPNEIKQNITGRYFEVHVESEEVCKVSTTSNWIELSSTQINAGGGELEFYIQDNFDDESRMGEIVISHSNLPKENASIKVIQYGYLESDDNAISSGKLTKDFRVGWGYNIFQEYQSVRSITSSIIDYNKLIKQEKTLGYPIIQEDNRSKQSINILSGYTINELAKSFSSSSQGDYKIIGCGKTIEKYIHNNSYNLDERSYGYGRLAKIVASRYMDEATVEYLVNDTDIDILSTEFNKACEGLKKDNSNEEDFIKHWGTHLVISADIGGMIEYFMDFKKSEVRDIQSYSEISSSYIFGARVSSGVTKKVQESLSIYHNASKSLSITAGSSVYIKQLQEQINSFSSNSTIDQSTLASWFASLEGDYRNDEKLQKRLTVVACKIIPIWNVIKDKDIKERVKAAAYIMAKDNNAHSGLIDNQNQHKIKIDTNWTKFSNEGTQIRIVRNKDQKPILEICNEYIPDIRTDRRVVVVYPIVNGKPNIAQGIFLGDGDGSLPAYVAFEGAKVYIQPIGNQKSNSVISEVYNIQGSLYIEDFVGIMDSNNSCEDVYCTINYPYNKGFKVPVIKIGSGYWARDNAPYTLRFLDEDDEDRRYKDDKTGIVYMFHFGKVDAEFLDTNKGLYGVNYWYLPKTEDVYNLKNYLYKNPKIIFKNQISGFDARFDGFYGAFNPHTQKYYPDKIYKVRNYNEYSYLACKDSKDSGSVLYVDKDYNISVLNDDPKYENYYPIRLFRSKNFKYK